MKICKKCGIKKTLADFNKKQGNKDGLRHECKECRKAYVREWREENKKMNATRICFPKTSHCNSCNSTKDFNFFNKDSSSKNGLNSYCRECSKKIDKKYYEKTKEERLEYQVQYRKDNPYKLKKKKAKYYQKIKDTPKYKFKAKANKANRRAITRKAEGTITAKIIKELYEEQDGLCAYCGIRTFDNYHVDHMIPLILGGSNLKENLCISCPDCNLSKGGKSMEDWMVYADWIVPPTNNKELNYVRI